MRIKLICIGKKEADLFQEAIQFYQKKLEYYCTFESISIPYLKNIQSLSVEEQKKREGELLLSKINPEIMSSFWMNKEKNMVLLLFQKLCNNGSTEELKP